MLHNRNVRRAEWECESKSGAFACRALDRDVAAHEAGQLAADGQPETASVRSAGETRRDLHEGLEDRLQHTGFDPLSPIFDPDGDKVIELLAAHSDRFAALAELGGIR